MYFIQTLYKTQLVFRFYRLQATGCIEKSLFRPNFVWSKYNDHRVWMRCVAKTSLPIVLQWVTKFWQSISLTPSLFLVSIRVFIQSIWFEQRFGHFTFCLDIFKQDLMQNEVFARHVVLTRSKI